MHRSIMALVVCIVAVNAISMTVTSNRDRCMIVSTNREEN